MPWDREPDMLNLPHFLGCINWTLVSVLEKYCCSPMIRVLVPGGTIPCPSKPLGSSRVNRRTCYDKK